MCATDFSGAGQRIAIVTLVGKTRRVILDGREYVVQAFRGSLPRSLKWGESRADIHKRLGPPTMSNEGISLSDRPKSPIQEARDADEFQDGEVIMRLIYTRGPRFPRGDRPPAHHCSQTAAEKMPRLWKQDRKWGLPVTRMLHLSWPAEDLWAPGCCALPGTHVSWR